MQKLAKVDLPACGKATAVATCHWHVAKSRLSNPPTTKKSQTAKAVWDFLSLHYKKDRV
ncbi:MAG: hypothetical protein J6K84_04440 [Oscillospiraceae bacterium]|nr:hypothetical protein [Oscillospiraceae bacterium]